MLLRLWDLGGLRNHSDECSEDQDNGGNVDRKDCLWGFGGAKTVVPVYPKRPARSQL